ncbi:MAG: tRNA uridine-5-carboxymethylaminomethyl(34) synthesis GTPase MnmE [Bacteroidota bacterium]
MNIQLSETIVAQATAPGVGAISVIRLSGPKAIQLADKAFYGKSLLEAASHTIHFGTIRDEHGQILDEVLVSLFVAPRSYTREHVVEISCHGSPYIVQQVLQYLIRLGARMANPGEFTLRAFLNGAMDLSQAEAVADLIASNSAASHSIAMQQMRGGFSNEIQALRQELIDFASLIELELDFSEEDVEFADRGQLATLVEKIRKLLNALIDSFQLGNVIKEGVSTVIAGRPNAGKSTLLNALLNEERAIVSEIAGTTRDTIEEILNIRGIQFRLIDTAGIRDASDQIEAIGVEKTMQKIQASSLLVYVYDAADLSEVEVAEDLKKLERENLKALVIANKSDLTDQAPQAENWLSISAKEGINVHQVKEALYKAVVNHEIALDQTVVANVRHYDALQSSDRSLETVLHGLQSGISGDLVAMDIRHALRHLGEITGEISTDDLLGNIFSRFCIGK